MSNFIQLGGPRKCGGCFPRCNSGDEPNIVAGLTLRRFQCSSLNSFNCNVGVVSDTTEPICRQGGLCSTRDRVLTSLRFLPFESQFFSDVATEVRLQECRRPVINNETRYQQGSLIEMTLMNTSRFSLVFLAFLYVSPVCAESLQSPASFDRWMYPFNATPGSRVVGSTFGAVMNPVFDDHDAQILLGFDLSSAPSDMTASSFQVASAVVTLTTASDNTFELDSSYDPFATYVDETSDADADADAGRPIELYGVGFRNGYVFGSVSDTAAGPPIFGETDSFSIPGPPAAEARFAFASDFKDGTPRDVSNSVRNSIELSPWAVGKTDAVNDGELVPVNSEFKFEIDLTNPDALSYLQNGLASGEVILSVVSMHSSTQGSAAGIPSFHLADANGISIGSTARIDIEYSIVPEPNPLGMSIGGLAVLALANRRRRRLR